MNNDVMNMLMRLMGMGNNPQQVIQNFVRQNPQAQIVLNQGMQSGMTPQQFLNQYMKQNNISDISPMVNMLNNRGMKNR